MAQLQKPTLRSVVVPALVGGTRPAGSFRWVICGLLFFATAINYIDRQILGILKPQLSHDLHWSQQDYANIVTAFQLTYAFGYLFGGRLMERFGVKRGLPAAALVWSLFAALHGLMRSVTGFSVVRLGLGISEGGIFPAAIKTVGEWFPLKERALATGIFNSASNIGAIICPLTVPFLALKYGWPAAFYITGALGIVWVVAWALVYDDPETHRWLSRGEREYIRQGRPPQAEKPAAVPWLTLLRDRAAWAYMAARLLADPVWWFYLFWIPGFLHDHFHLSQTQTGSRVGAVYAMAVVGSIGGRLARRPPARPGVEPQRRPQDLAAGLRPVRAPRLRRPVRPELLGRRAAGGPGCRRPSGLVGEPLHLRLGHGAETSRQLRGRIGRLRGGDRQHGERADRRQGADAHPQQLRPHLRLGLHHVRHRLGLHPDSRPQDRAGGQAGSLKTFPVTWCRIGLS